MFFEAMASGSDSTRSASTKRADEGFGEMNAPWIEVGHQRAIIPDHGTLRIGRDPTCGLCLDDETVSWEHAGVGNRDGAMQIWDLGSRNGTFVDDLPVQRVGTRLRHGARVRIGDLEGVFRLRRGGRTGHLPRVRRYDFDRELRVGRAEENDVVLDEPNVSRSHASLTPGPPAELHDLASRNGVRLNGSQVGRTTRLTPGDEIGIGPYRLVLDGSSITVIDDRGGMLLRSLGACVRVGRETILQPTTMTIAQGEFVGLIGPSGSGKTTLLKNLAATSNPTEGSVLLDQDPASVRRTDIGYVPQADTIHPRLTVAESLKYAARLRLPSDSSKSEISDRVEAVLEELELTEQASTQNQSVSGGQRKRVACGVELVGMPTMLLLDEPTSGLDPPLERLLMEMLRRLADEGRGVLVCTHATSSLALCDTVAVMGAGGSLRFQGAPQAALDHFGVEHYDEIYGEVTGELAEQVSEEAPRPRQLRRRGRRTQPGRSFLSHFAAVSGRYARNLFRDRRTMFVLLAQVPIIAVLVSVLFPADLLSQSDVEPAKSAQFMFLIVTVAIWLGLISACREVVTERSMVLRELAIGLRLDAYISAKALVLFLVATVEAALLFGIAFTLQPAHVDPGGYAAVFAIVVASCWGAVAMGLAASTVARSVDQATSLVPLLLVPQLLFAGAIVPYESMQRPVQLLSDAIMARWAFAGSGNAIDLTGRLAQQNELATYGPNFFSVRPALAVLILLAFTAVGLIVAAAFLARAARRSL
jgi:ABC-type multidrug transport system ATPase subunit/pSer/pThr/pTyr-binding forkhead associated (FHA) protein